MKTNGKGFHLKMEEEKKWAALERGNSSFDPKAAEKALEAVVNCIDDYRIVNAFEFLGRPGSESNFNLLGWAWLEPVLNPALAWHEKEGSRLYEALDEALAHTGKLQSDLRSLSECWDNRAYELREFGFHIGVLVGAALMGASRERLLDIAKGLVKTISIQPRFKGSEKVRRAEKPRRQLQAVNE